ncbi:outer membrane beta barrel protein [Prolixibacter bellariivorans]|uniref:Outer membrane beta barrel protein n=1 Tax=Prolixibacter bellariivorans TaxID=314319 RepID=A0A5M4B3T3_9BACT|nr:hypothetical protein [Prolixibacter bellariivorans]GET34453.1 outer membrane beta barrel protein [Prolixibacter bellariivorans]
MVISKRKILITGLLLFLITPLFSQNEKKEKSVQIGGALRFNYRYKAWDKANTNVGGDFVLDMFRINAKARYGKLFLNAEYRFYPSDFGGGMLKQGFVGYDFTPKTQLQIGVNQVPFGALPYASHSWFFNLPYYIGLEDDYDTGIKLVHSTDDWDFMMAFYKNAEGGKTWNTFSDGSSGYGVDKARYSYDVAGDDEERGQWNGRIARKFGHSEVGLSAEYGRLFNHVTKGNGDHYAFAAHFDGNFLPKQQLNVKLEALTYAYNSDANTNTVTMAAYNYTYQVAKEGQVYTAGVAYTIPVSFGPITSVQFYEDYNYMNKNVDGFLDTQMNVVGALISTSAGLYTYVDYASGKNQDWFGPWGHGLGQGSDNEWHSWFNINIGYYF